MDNLIKAWELYKESDGVLNSWEEQFLLDNYQRFEQYKDRTKFSDKQASTIEKILEKLQK